MQLRIELLRLNFLFVLLFIRLLERWRSSRSLVGGRSPRFLFFSRFAAALSSADRVRTNEGGAHGAVILLVPAGTDLSAVGYPLVEGEQGDGGMAAGGLELLGGVSVES